MVPPLCEVQARQSTTPMLASFLLLDLHQSLSDEIELLEHLIHLFHALALFNAREGRYNPVQPVLPGQLGHLWLGHADDVTLRKVRLNVLDLLVAEVAEAGGQSLHRGQPMWPGPAARGHLSSERVGAFQRGAV